MLNALIDFSLKNRFVVLLLGGVLIVLGVRAAIYLPLDAFPDTTPVQVQINTTAPELAPEEIERQITFPVEMALGGLKGLEDVRSISKFGLSQVVAIFEDGTDIYFARQQINERLGEVQLPNDIERPTMGPVATGLGEVFHYIITSENPEYDLAELRSIQDWVVRPRLLRVPGVAEVNPWGGLAKQYEVRVDPTRLAKYGLSLDEVIQALEENNKNVGGGYILRAGESTLVQGVGRARSLEEIGKIVITARDGVPIRIGDLGEVALGHRIRRGGATANGQGEVILGLAFMRMGENSRLVTMALHKALEEVKSALPKGVEISPVYERTHLVDQVLKTVERNLFEGAVLVIAVLFAFLGNFRAGLIVASAIPFSMLFAVTMMERVGIAGSLMSLGAIDFGLVVDSSVVMVENCVRHLAHDRSNRSKLDVIREAAVEVRKPTMFGELIIMIVYLPILTLQGIEGKLFRPMALTVVFALAGSMVLSLTLMPALASLGLPRAMRDRETWVDKIAHRLFQPMLRLGLRFPWTTLGLVGSITIGTTILGLSLGSEFVPRLNEGTIVINTIRLASVSLEESLEYGTRIEALLKESFPDEIEQIWSRTGTAEVATDPMGFEVSDVYVTLKSRDRWKKATSQDQLVEEMAKVTETLPGMRAVYSQPIELRLNEMVAGIRADLGIKLFGEDLELLKDKGAEIERVVKQIRGAADVSTEQVTGLPVLRVEVNRDALARHGIPARQVLDTIKAAGGIPVGAILEHDRRFPLVVRLPMTYRDDPRSLEKIMIETAAGQRLPLTRLASVVETTGPSTIQREWGQRRIVVQSNVRGRDIGSFVEEAQRRIEREVSLPTGYYLEWGGQFENMRRAEQRLMIVVPLALALVLSLLYLTFHSVRDALMIFSGVLFARVGGVLGLWLRGMPFTISAGVGFVALAGASMLEGLVLVSYIRDRMAHGVSKREAIEQARLARLRPVLMTGAVAALGFAPMMLSTGVGAEVQRPLATVVFFGMVCDTFLTMLALPVLYLLFGKGPVPQAEIPENQGLVDEAELMGQERSAPFVEV
ncbi:efflux RND transporter permease subunit [Singulisphaera acidiphila]|uniref:Heavy metal efflux pump, cobalt-zinc-cadmium n=1 Tax=Singulisphaera acidiphila (strain ATCC BAA-1392 / DSM 18658 / VKM B-2454 / MOB10) TaxID=886293 RepID=L0DCR8_SINAD|nr:CusA/CzcA family heavy metal efflux RND transporter [Singulisphaera acidiphila]AGA26431.1 heavy metal efflux pump, cobalt-zinc-cadmium [Singulisphaera acidiphila DSM 18658]